MNKPGSSQYQVEDLVMDQSFVNYYFELDENDRKQWQSRIDLDPASAIVASQAGEILEQLSLRLPGAEFDQEYERLKHSLHTHSVHGNFPGLGTTSPPLNTIIPRRTRKTRYLFILPVVALLAFCVFYFYREPSNGANSLVEKVNKGTRPVILTLNDQTVVTLGPNSSLKYQKSFDEAARKVYLQGEAEFNVTKDAKRPFFVYAGELVTTVLGTVFRVSHQQADSLMLVELLSGKLKVETNGPGQSTQTIFLAPSERVIYNRLDKKLTKQSWQEAAPTPGKRGTLNFRKDDFESVARKIKDEFGLTVINLSAKKAWSFTGSFTNSTAKEIVENICIVKQLAYELKADTIFIK